MKITSIELFGFKPMLHGGIKHLKVDVNSNTLCVIGNNGSGKSTVLKELHPFPATSSNYISGGYKELLIVDGESLFRIRSEFEGRGIKHTFEKNGIELNLSGTTGVQTELCEQEFGLTTAIKQLVQGVVKICRMPITMRKKLLLACYPSDLTFILEHHKRIGSLLRASKSNIKMQHDRLVELESQAIPKEAYVVLLDKLAQLDTFRGNVLSAIAVYETELRTVVGHECYDPDAPDCNIEDLQSRITGFQRDASRNYRKMPFKYLDDAKEKYSEFRTRSDMLYEDQEKISSEIVDLVQEIDRFEQLSEEMSADKVSAQLGVIDDLKNSIEVLHIDRSLPTIPLNKFAVMDLFQLQESALTIAAVESKILPQEEFIVLQSTIAVNNSKIEKHTIELTQLDRNREKLRQQLGSSNISKFRDGCVLACVAREDVESYHNTLKLEYDETLVAMEAAFKLVEGLKESHADSVILFEANASIQPVIEHVANMLYPIAVELQVAGGKPLDMQIIENPTALSNLVDRLHKNSNVQKELVEYSETLIREEQLLTTLQEARSEKQELLSQFNVGKGNRVEALKRQHAELKVRHVDAIKQMDGYKVFLNQINELDSMSIYVEQTIHTALVNKKAAWLSDCLDKLQGILKITEDERLNTNTVLKAQEAIRIRIDQEILPNIEKLNSERDRLSILEQALSPVEGLPHVYMVRFMNNVLVYVNAIIARVWNYEIEVLPLKATARMDFTFKVKLFTNGSVKDINMLSDGQQEMVDLAFTLALYKVMHLGEKFPLKLDEVDAGLTTHHRTKLLELLSNLLSTNEISQLILVNHHSSLFSGFPNAQICVLDEDGIVLPSEYNQDVEITRH